MVWRADDQPRSRSLGVALRIFEHLPDVAEKNPAVAQRRAYDRPSGAGTQQGGVSDAAIAQGLHVHVRPQALVAPQAKGPASIGQESTIMVEEEHIAQARFPGFFLPHSGAIGV